MPDLSQSEKFEIMFARMAWLEQQLTEQQHQITEQQKTIARLEAQTPQIEETSLEPAPAPLTTTRRKMLGKLAAAMIAGAAAASVLPGGEAQARVGIDLKADDGSRRIGAIVVPPGAALPTGITAAFGPTVKYGLVATDGTDTSFTLASLPGYGTGVYGNGSFYGVYGNGTYTGVYGDSANIGVYGYGTYTGVYGYGNGSSSNGVVGNGLDTGVYGYGRGSGSIGGRFIGAKVGAVGNGDSNFSVSNTTVPSTHIGLVGNSGSDLDLTAISAGYNIGVYGRSPVALNNYAGFFQGNVQVTGTLSKGGGSFKIDHPLDPSNKYLYHSFVESPDMKNIYDDIAVLDANGEAVVTLPGWFETLNRDFRYGLTPIGKASPNLYIAQEVSKNSFKIAGGQTGLKVSWQITGIRQDKWANAHRIPVEETKPANEKGLYLHPTLYGQSEDKSVNPKPPSSLANPAPAAAPPVVPPTLEKPAAPPTPSNQTKP